ncbi:MAG TPA: ABC transporter permease [Vicinamibacterales bacterium]|nr:ABC transporter permease [Vicinamibacterales bacterium]
MSLPWFIARRYLTARRRQAFISLISIVSTLGVGVGVMALIIALGLMTGVQQELRDRIVGSSAHVYIYKAGPGVLDLEAMRERIFLPGVEAAAPVVTSLGLLTRQAGAATPVTLRGVDPVLETSVTELASAMSEGSLEALANRSPDARDGMLVGVGLAKSLGVSVGDVVFFISDQVAVVPGGVAARPRPFEIVGLFEFGLLQTDQSTAVVGLDAAMRMLRRAGPDLIEVRVTDLDVAPRLRREIDESLGPGYILSDWTELNAPLYSALWLEKVAISLTIGLIIMVAALNIVASLVLLVMEKSRDIAILRTMGAPASLVRRIFIYQGLAIGLVGTTVGLGLGLLVCEIADRNRLITLPSDVYQITYLPFRVETFDVVVVFLSAVLVCFLATIYPSRQAGRIDPAEALRNQ